ncbi:MAG: dTMP kinase, partial [Candidatus Altiarchaeales archaeon]|nr:dTMP kinase [Candidatus Altiarchaeales archaeon]
MFIVLEGVDGCGKSTHAKLLGQWLEDEGVCVFLTAEPTKGFLGDALRSFLSGYQSLDPLSLSLLFCADRMQHLSEEIKPALSEGKTVVCERYVHSTIAYQAAQGVDWDWLWQLNRFALEPELVLYLDVDPEVGVERTTTGEVFEKKEFLSKVR